MDTGGLIRTGLLVFSICVCVVTGSPIGNSIINCAEDNYQYVGAVDEGYTGDVEVVSGITAGVKLVPHIFQTHLEFLELSFTLGDTIATVRTKKPLDADVLANSDSTLYYSVMCDSAGLPKYNNTRTLKINDLNDHSPIFTQEIYTTSVSEIHNVDSEVLRVTAVDGDSTAANNRVSYSIAPTSEDFMVTNSGAFMLKRRLNYNLVQKYNFLVTARDNGGLNDTATVLINVVDFDNLNPYFSHNVYQAVIAENQVGSFRTIEPEPIKAQDGDSGINVTLIYSIGAVSPDKYRSNFNIDSSSGVVSVLTALDREEMNSSVISLSIKVAQTDDGLKTADAVVSVTIEDVNDNPPEFDQSEYSVTLLENSPVDAVLFKAVVIDLDQGGFVGTLRILQESAPFSVSPDGTVRVKNSTALDRETTESITFQIEAKETDPPNNVAVVQVIVTLLDENDNIPVFTSKKYEGKVFANQTVGMSLVQVKAEDPDAGENGQIKYSIDFGNNDGYFSIEENSGDISLAKTIPLVENMILKFPLYITARDGGTISRSSSAQVNIDAPGSSKPQFLQKVYHGTVEEERDSGVVILRVNFLAIATEIPVNLVVDTEADKFAISNSGEFTNKVKLDYDEAPHNYSVSISISDGITSDNAVVEVQVTDVNDNSPVFTSSSVTESVPEDAEVGSNVTVVPATDKDSSFNKEIRYSLRGGEARFSIDPVSGMVTVAGALDRETKAEYNLLVVAEDQGRPVRSATASLLVQVSDINDNIPKFSVAEYQVEVLETESAGTSLLTLSAVDPDEGANGRVTYSIFQQSPSSDPPVFELNSSNGTLRLAQLLDYSEVKVYSLMVQASDGGTPSLVGNGSVVVKVKDVNNNPPEFSKESFDVAVSENLASGTSILTLVVTDTDEGGFVGTLRILPESAPFSISSDGTISVRNSTALDRETTETIMFQVEAKETEPPNHVATAIVNITLLDENDNSPKFTSSQYESKVFTNQTEGMLLVKVEAEDPDAGVNGQIKYSIDFGNQNEYFSIDENTGAITLTKIIPVERHQSLEFLLFITARDGGVVSRSAAAQVEILAVGDTKPQFTQSTYSGTIEEERDSGTMILKVDFLATGEIPVNLVVETEADKFAISNSGEFTTKVKLDYDEASHNYSVSISISDGINSDNAVVEVQVTDVNDNSPVFTSSSVTESVPEDAEVGSNVTVVPATDKDSSFNKEIRYSLRGGEARFSIDPVSGMVTVAGALDRETKAEYNLLVVAEDQGRPVRSATASLLVQVSDINDNIPKFSVAEYQVEVLETESAGTSLLTLSAVDPDEGANGRVTYSIFQQSPSSDPPVFELNSSNGTLRLAQLLDYSEVKVYSLMVQASDGGTPSLVGNGSVVVKVKDVNNNPPEFSKESFDVAVSENLASGTSILTLVVTDTDEGGFVGTLRILPESAPFSISSDGTISVRNSTALDRETTETIMFQVEAKETEPPNHVATAIVNITLLDENDNSPKFTSSQYESKVFTNQTEGMLLVKVEAEDPDAGVNGQIKYSIDFGNQNEYFSIDENTGAITLTKIIPVERHQSLEFLLFITARDGGVVSRSAAAQVEILAVEDTKPQFTQSTYSGTIEEERDSGTMILKVDFLATGEIPVNLVVETEADKFAISNSGEFTTKVKLDYDEASHNYSVSISISDGINSDNAVVEVQVTDVNDNSPVFTSSSVTESVPEDAEVGSNVTVVPATDKDSSFNKEIRYSLRGGEARFSIDPVSGMVTVAGALDRETKAEYNLLVVAEDQGRPVRSATASLLVQVSDINDNIPKFSVAEYQVEVLETESAGTSLLTLSAVDPDEGANGRVTYSIFQQSPSSDPPVFELNSSNGTLRLAQLLDYSEVKVYSLMVQASDGGTPSLVGNGSVVVKVKDVNNNPPEFSKESFDVAVSENLASGTSILTLVVTDTDEGGFVGTLRILPESAPFSISSDGTISVRNSTALDRETTETIMFQVEAKETEPPNHVATAIVNITLLDENDNSPKFTSSQYESKVFTNQTEGMLLVKVEAEDPDAGVNGQIKYSIDFGNQNEYFSIDENTGAITLTKIIPVERHQSLEFLLFITARDGGVVSRSAAAQVEILAVEDTKPQFTQSTYSGTIEEERDSGTMILKVDFLATGEIPVNLVVETEADKFAISNSGEFTTKVKLDYDEASHNYSVSISISDGINSDNAVVEVQVTDVNDNSPVFTSSSVTESVPEDAEVGSNVTVVPATDKDSSFNKEIRYSLRGGEARFSIDPVSGMVTVAGALDRETKAEYNLLVVAEDQGRPVRSATASLLVQVSDINDNIPKFSVAEYQVEVLETESAGTSLLTLSAVDPDEGANGRVTYSIFQQSPSSDPPVFELDSSSGILQLAQTLDYSEVKVYSLMVQASDGGTPSLVGNGSVVVKVKDVNNNPPEFSKESYDMAVSENLASGASILTLEVTDRDEGGFSDGYFIYTNNTFDINKQGVVSLRKDVTLDRETKDSYILQVVAVDQVTDGLRSTAQLNITVLDYNDNAPQFPSIPDPLRVPEGQYSDVTPEEVFTFVPTDADLGHNGEVTISLSSPHPLFRFREDGTLLAVGSLDRESRETYELFVKASDKGSPQRENVTTIRVSLTDVNDNRPEFSSSRYVGSVLLKDAEEGKLLLTLSATDRDVGNNSLITYSFCAGNSPYLALNSETGAVTLTFDLANVTEDTTLVLTAMAKDHGHPPLNSTASVVVNLRVVSLVEGVAFRSSSYNFSLPENQPAGVTVGRVWASSGSDLYDVAYTLKTHTDLFSVNASGDVLTRTRLDKEEQEWYILDVEAVDTRIPPTSAVAMVRVQVEDVNESPQFPSEVYKASVFSIAPYKTAVLHVKASDPDVGEEGQLVYSLTADSPYFDVEPSSGLVYVVSAVELAGQLAAVEVKATDPRGLHATAKVEVEVQGSASSGDMVVVSLNQPANIVEKKVPELEKSLGAALGWTVNIIEVSSANGGSSQSRTLRDAMKTLVSFISEDGGEVVSSEEVTKKLQSQSAAVREELVKVFGESLHFDVEIKPQSPDSNQAVVIALGAMFALSMLGLIVAVALIIRFKTKQKHQEDSDKESFDIDRSAEGYTSWPQKTPETIEKEQTRSQKRGAEDEQQRTDRKTDDGWTEKTDGNGARFKVDRQTEDVDSDSNESHTSAL